MSRLTFLSALLFLGLTVLPRAARAEPGVEHLRTALSGFNSAARFPLPELSEGELAQLAQGRVVVVRVVPEDREQPQRAVGLLLTDHSREALWLACQDTHYTSAEGLTERRLGPDADGRMVWYGFLDLPRPFSDRHWSVAVDNTVALHEATNGDSWEHWWELDSGALPRAEAAVLRGEVGEIDLELFEAAIATPVNHGAWLTIRVGESTVIGYHATSVVGGAIPDRLVADFALSRMRGLLRGVERRAVEMPAHYRGDHPPLPGGDNQPLPRFP